MKIAHYYGSMAGVGACGAHGYVTVYARDVTCPKCRAILLAKKPGE